MKKDKRLLKGVANYILEHINDKDLSSVMFTVLHDINKSVNNNKWFIPRTNRFADLTYTLKRKAERRKNGITKNIRNPS